MSKYVGPPPHDWIGSIGPGPIASGPVVPPLLKESVRLKPTGWSSTYYVLPEHAKELQDLIEYRNMNFAVGNIFKAAYRLGEKSGVDREYDLQKIIWFAQRELARINVDKGEV